MSGRDEYDFYASGSGTGLGGREAFDRGIQQQAVLGTGLGGREEFDRAIQQQAVSSLSGSDMYGAPPGFAEQHALYAAIQEEINTPAQQVTSKATSGSASSVKRSRQSSSVTLDEDKKSGKSSLIRPVGK